MEMKIAQVIGLNTDQKAAQVISSTQGEQTFLAVLEVSCDDAFTKGRQLLSEFESLYFESDGTIPEKLNATFKEAEGKLKEIDGGSLGLAVVSSKVLYLIGQGQVEIYLKRNDKLMPLLAVGAPAQLISGFLQGGDRVLIATKTLVNFLGEDLSKSLSLPIDVFEDEILDRIATTQDVEDQGLAALSVEIKEEKEQEEDLAMNNLQQEVSPVESSAHFPTPQLHIPKIAITGHIKDTLRNVFHLLLNFKSYLPKGGKGRLILAAILITVLVSGLGFQFISSKNEQKRAQFNQLLQAAKDDFSASKSLASLSPGEAKNRLDSAKDKVNQAVAIDSKNTEAADLKNQIDQESGSILQKASVSEFPEFLDMDLVKQNFRAQSMSLSVNKLLLLDPTVKTLVMIDLGKKSNQILAGESQLGDARFSSLNGAVAFIYSKDKGVIKIDSTNQKVSTVAQKDDDLGDVADISAFASNVYLLDSKMIWKYLPTTDGYSDKREYLVEGATVDLSNSIKMQIESSIYVLKRDGQMLRFTRGESDHFSYEGLPSGIKDPKSFFVSSDTDDLYILDSGNSRLLILTKTGAYKGQISGDKFATASDLVVDEVSKKIYLLDGSKIYSLDLK